MERIVNTRKGTISRSNMKRQNNSNFSQPPRLTIILGSFLEVLTHEIIYTRSLYPHDAFSPTRHYGVACHACRHPDVVDYIFETLQVAVSGIVSGLIDGLYLIFYDAETDILLERYALEFQLDETVKIVESQSAHGDAQDVNEREELEKKIQELERSLRDVLLKVVSLNGTDLGRKRGQGNFSASTTFKLCLHTVEASSPVNAPNGQCPELDEAMREGKWFRADSESCSFDNSSITAPDMIDGGGTGSLTRPLKSINVPSCGLKLQLLIEFPT